MQKSYKDVSYWITLLIVFAISLWFFSNLGNQPLEVTYSAALKYIESGEVDELKLKEDSIYLTMSDGTRLSAMIPSAEIFHEDAGEIISKQIQTDTLNYLVVPDGFSWGSLLVALIPVLIIIGFWVFMMSKNNSHLDGGFTKNRAKLFMDKDKKILFANVAGSVEEKAELQEVVQFLKNPEGFFKLGARIPKGILLVGPPGTGKTMLAKAVAGEAGVPFFSISGSDFVELYVGVGASRVRDLFEQAKKANPCIIFIDEIDAVGRRRGAGLGGGHDEREQTLNQLLVEMDGFESNDGIIVIAATNRPDILDSALLRPGRFDRQVVVDLPDVSEREEILKLHAEKKPVSEEIDFKQIARTTAGTTGADLENILNEAAILAARDGRELIEPKDIREANVKVMMGPEKRSRVISDSDKKITAYHEAGHALLTKLYSKREKVHQVSIIPRGRSGGHTMGIPTEDFAHYTKTDIENEIVVLLGGRAAEEIIFDDISTGASSDIKRATKLARQMITRFGMSEKLGPVCYDDEEEVFIGRDYGHSKGYSEVMAGRIDAEVENIINTFYKKAVAALNENKESLHKIVSVLLEKETIGEDEFNAIFE